MVVIPKLLMKNKVAFVIRKQAGLPCSCPPRPHHHTRHLAALHPWPLTGCLLHTWPHPVAGDLETAAWASASCGSHPEPMLQF